MSRIPSQTEYAAWRLDFKVRYKAAHAVPYSLQVKPNDFEDDTPEADDPEAAIAWMTKHERDTKRYEDGRKEFENIAGFQAAGLSARLDKIPLKDNPHPDGTDEWYSWFKGYGLYDPLLKITP